MNTIQKLMLALLMLGSMPGAVLAMNPGDHGLFGSIPAKNEFDADGDGDDEDGDDEYQDALDKDDEDDVEKDAIDGQDEDDEEEDEGPKGPIIYIFPVDQPLKSVASLSDILSGKVQSLMTKRALVGLTGIMLAMTGLRYVYVSSVIKQVADLQSLRTECDAVLKSVLKGQTDPQLVEVDFITCFGLNQELQDKLDDAVSGYNIALQQVCHELCADQGGPIVNRIKVEQARKAMTLCNQVIDECQELLIKKPTVVDAMIKKGSLFARAFTAQVKTTTIAIAHKFKHSVVKKT